MGESIVRQANLKVLRIAADGALPHLVQLNTIESDDNVDCFLFHIPDFRSYWGRREGFRWRDLARVEVRDQSPPELNGVYYGWKSFALDLMPLSEHTGFCGDAFVAKTALREFDEEAAAYEDVPLAIVGSQVLGLTLEKLREM